MFSVGRAADASSDSSGGSPGRRIIYEKVSLFRQHRHRTVFNMLKHLDVDFDQRALHMVRTGRLTPFNLETQSL